VKIAGEGEGEQLLRRQRGVDVDIQTHLTGYPLHFVHSPNPHPCGHSCNSTESNKGGSDHSETVGHARNGGRGVVRSKHAHGGIVVGGSTKGIDLEPNA
jgi:hypothetical protein